MSDMVERAANAVHAEHMIAKGPLAAWSWDQANKDFYRRLVKAAIAAMQADAAPVAWMYRNEVQQEYASRVRHEFRTKGIIKWTETPLYAHPPVVARVSTTNPVDDRGSGNTSDKLRPAVDVWRDAYDAFTDFYHHTTEKDPARVIEADRQATRAALVAEIVAWLRGNCMSGKWRILASEIEAKWGKL